MYADQVSDAMRAAIDETDRRRRIQHEYNQANGITPVSIRKSIQSIIARKKEEKRTDEEKQLDILKKSYNVLVPTQRKKLISLPGKGDVGARQEPRV